jgi:NADH-quinone oxidoreductase subunit N
MTTIIIKSFLPEIFFSLAILIQLVFNTKLVNSLKYNFPVIEKEVFYQTIFIFALFILFQYGLKIEGAFDTNTLVNNEIIKNIKILFSLITIFALIIVNQAFTLQKLSFFEFYIIFSLSALSLIFMISCSDLLIFYLLMEMQALCSIFSVEGGIKYFISGAFVSGFYLLGVSYLYGSLGTINLNSLQSLFSSDLVGYSETLVYIVNFSITLITCTLLFKIACAPFHFWSPDVYDGAPLSSTIVFSIVPKLPLFYFFMKWLNCISNIAEGLSTVLLVFGILSVFVGTFFAINQKRLKRLMVYSSIAQTGFLVCGISFFNLQGYSYTVAFLILYIVTSLLIWGHFVLFNFFYKKTNQHYSKNLISLHISTMDNLFNINTFWSLSLVIVFFSIAGIPPLSGFLAKFLIIFNLVNQNEIIMAILLVLISAISVYYYIRILKIAFFEPKNNLLNDGFKTIHVWHSSETLIFIIPILLSVLIFLFYNPSLFLLISEYIAFGTFVY